MAYLDPIAQASANVGGGAIPLWAVFLVFAGVVFLFGLFYARQNSQVEPKERHGRGSPQRVKATRASEASVTPLLIDIVEEISEQAGTIQINLEDQPPAPAATGMVTPRRDPAGDE